MRVAQSNEIENLPAGTQLWAEQAEITSHSLDQHYACPVQTNIHLYASAINYI